MLLRSPEILLANLVHNVPQCCSFSSATILASLLNDLLTKITSGSDTVKDLAYKTAINFAKNATGSTLTACFQELIGIIRKTDFMVS